MNSSFGSLFTKVKPVGLGSTAIVEVNCFAKVPREGGPVMDMVIFRTIFFELLVFFTFTLLTIHFAY